MILLMEEILHQLIGSLSESLSHSLQGFDHPRWCRISSINSMEHLYHLSYLNHKYLIYIIIIWLIDYYGPSVIYKS